MASSLVKLDVGGTKYKTSLCTLALVEPASMLARMVQQEREAHMIHNGEEIFIDRDGELFKYILEDHAKSHEWLGTGDGIGEGSHWMSGNIRADERGFFGQGFPSGSDITGTDYCEVCRAGTQAFELKLMDIIRNVADDDLGTHMRDPYHK